MKSNDIIKHENSLDVAFFIMNTTRLTNSTVLRGMWLNQGFVTTSVISGELTSIAILDENRHKWLVCLNPNAQCVRNESWERVKGVS